MSKRFPEPIGGAQGKQATALLPCVVDASGVVEDCLEQSRQIARVHTAAGQDITFVDREGVSAAAAAASVGAEDALSAFDLRCGLLRGVVAL